MLRCVSLRIGWKDSNKVEENANLLFFKVYSTNNMGTPKLQSTFLIQQYQATTVACSHISLELKHNNLEHNEILTDKLK